MSASLKSKLDRHNSVVFALREDSSYCIIITKTRPPYCCMVFSVRLATQGGDNHRISDSCPGLRRRCPQLNREKYPAQTDNHYQRLRGKDDGEVH